MSIWWHLHTVRSMLSPVYILQQHFRLEVNWNMHIKMQACVLSYFIFKLVCMALSFCLSEFSGYKISHLKCKKALVSFHCNWNCNMLPSLVWYLNSRLSILLISYLFLILVFLLPLFLRWLCSCLGICICVCFPSYCDIKHPATYHTIPCYTLCYIVIPNSVF